MNGQTNDDCQHPIVQEVETASGRKLACQLCGKILASGQEEQEPVVQAEPKVKTPDDIEPDTPASGLAELFSNICQSEAVTGKQHDEYMTPRDFLTEHHVVPPGYDPNSRELIAARQSTWPEDQRNLQNQEQATLDSWGVA